MTAFAFLWAAFWSVPRLTSADASNPLPAATATSTIRDFCRSLKDASANIHLLLIDSEQPDDGQLFPDLLQQRDWQVPAEFAVTETHVYWMVYCMVYCMEASFVADPEALRAHYGREFRDWAAPKDQNAEKVDKQRLFDKLKAATRETQMGSYRKGADAPMLLARLNPQEVANHAPNFKRLVNFLQSVELR